MPRNSLGDISRAPMISRLSSCNSGSRSSRSSKKCTLSLRPSQRPQASPTATSVDQRGTSSLSKVRHVSTSTIFAGKRDSFSPALGLGLLSQLHLVVPRSRAVDIRTMPTSILLRADQVVEEACLLQRMSLFLAHRVISLRYGIWSLPGHSRHSSRLHHRT